MFKQLKMPYHWDEETRAKADAIGSFSCAGCAGDLSEEAEGTKGSEDEVKA